MFIAAERSELALAIVDDFTRECLALIPDTAARAAGRAQRASARYAAYQDGTGTPACVGEPVQEFLFVVPGSA